MMAASPLAQLAASAKVPTTLFWSGAGISRDSPTCLPLADGLASRLAKLFEAGALEKIGRATRMIGVMNRPHPRLELVMDIVTRSTTYGEAGFQVLSDFGSVSPNPLHRFFGEHLACGGWHITANFDNCIEAAAACSAHERVYHFHGSLGGQNEQELRATLRSVETGFPQAAKDRVAFMLDGCSLVIFVGYSGSDFFDVQPFLREYAANRDLTGKRYIWIGHDSAAEEPRMVEWGMSTRLAPEDVVAARHLSWFAASGADAFLVRGRTRDCLTQLCSGWLRSPSPEEQGEEREWQLGFEPRLGQMRQASLELYHATGFWRPVNVLLRSHPELLEVPTNLGVAADSARAQGKYSEARRLWMRMYSSGMPTANACLYWERVGATFWLQGRYWLAWVALLRAGKFAEPGSFEDACVTDTTLHLLGHMKRYWGFRWFATERRFGRVRARVPEGATQLGHDIAARVLSSAASTETQRKERQQAAMETFEESDQLNGVLNYRHGLMRGNPTNSPEDLRTHRRRFLYLGARADAFATMLLPGGPAAFRWGQFRLGMRGDQVSLWHRIRLTMRFTGLRWRAKHVGSE